MKKFALLICLFLITNLLYARSSEPTSKTKELQVLIKSVEKLNNNTNQQAQEKFYKNKLAVQQAKLLILDTTCFIYRYHEGKRDFDEIYKIVSAAYECSFIFTELGYDHLDTFVRILGWAEWESRFSSKVVCPWKKGTWVERNGERLYIKFDSIDYGTWQVSNQHMSYLRKINRLYTSGIITIKIKHIKKMDDVLDIPTNCVARCVIETDRKRRHWPWKHDNEKNFINQLSIRIYKLREIQKLYNRQLTQKYYHLIPIKTYTGNYK